MKYCPICDARYDEDVIRFCTKDGTPLVDVEEPHFTVLPSENMPIDDDQDTVIRRKPDETPFEPRTEPERIVISTEPDPPPVRAARTMPVYVPAVRQEPNTAKTVILTIAGTLAVLGFGALLFWLLQKDNSSNLNVNVNTTFANQNANLNSNVGFDSNFNFNTNINSIPSPNFNYNASSFNTNFNTNIRVPSPSPTPRLTASPTQAPTSAPTPATTPTPRPTSTGDGTRPTPNSTPRPGPRLPPLANRPPENN